MRNRVSGKKRMIILVVAAIIAVVAIVFLVFKLQSYTGYLQEDFSRVGVLCTDIKVVSDGDVLSAVDDAEFVASLSQEELSSIASANGEICVVELEYTFFSNIKKKAVDFSVKVSGTEMSQGKVYAYSDLYGFSVADNAYVMKQKLIVDKADIREKYFNEELPQNFKASYQYELSYSLEGEGKQNTVGFVTAGK